MRDTTGAVEFGICFTFRLQRARLSIPMRKKLKYPTNPGGKIQKLQCLSLPFNNFDLPIRLHTPPCKMRVHSPARSPVSNIDIWLLCAPHSCGVAVLPCGGQVTLSHVLGLLALGHQQVDVSREGKCANCKMHLTR